MSPQLIYYIVVAVVVIGPPVVTAFMYYWDTHILVFLNGTVRNLVVKKFGEVWGNRFGTALTWIDKGVNFVTKTFQTVCKLAKPFVGRGISDTGIQIKPTTTPIKSPAGEGQIILRKEIEIET